MNKILISFSGGRTSAFMCKLILEHPTYNDYEKLFVFANTGKEREETLCFVDQVDKEFNLNLVWLKRIYHQQKAKERITE
jgi:3'-phosphoadenosine 5'-phosphosulfate sulfotransferase (PAPS reductase)/FAD synthetase